MLKKRFDKMNDFAILLFNVEVKSILWGVKEKLKTVKIKKEKFMEKI